MQEIGGNFQYLSAYCYLPLLGYYFMKLKTQDSIDIRQFLPQLQCYFRFRVACISPWWRLVRRIPSKSNELGAAIGRFVGEIMVVVFPQTGATAAGILWEGGKFFFPETTSPSFLQATYSITN